MGLGTGIEWAQIWKLLIFNAICLRWRAYKNAGHSRVLQRVSGSQYLRVNESLWKLCIKKCTRKWRKTRVVNSLLGFVCLDTTWWFFEETRGFAFTMAFSPFVYVVNQTGMLCFIRYYFNFRAGIKLGHAHRHRQVESSLILVTVQKMDCPGVAGLVWPWVRAHLRVREIHPHKASFWNRFGSMTWGTNSANAPKMCQKQIGKPEFNEIKYHFLKRPSDS